MPRLSILALLLVVSCFETMAQQVRILSGYSFHQSSLGEEYGLLEDTSNPDNGGVLYLMVRNESGSPDGIDSIAVRSAIGDDYLPEGWLVWPPIMTDQNGNISTITIKGTDAPMANGSQLKVLVYSANGAKDSVTINSLSTPDLRLANAIPSQDGGSLFLYVRNDGDHEMILDSLYINDRAYSCGGSNAVISVSGSWSVESKAVAILQITDGLNLAETAPLALRLKHHVWYSQSVAIWVSAGIRAVAPTAPIGSWQSSGLAPENEEGRKRLRHIGVEQLHGIGNPTEMADGFQRYHISTVREPGFGDPFDVNNAIPEIQALSAESFIKTWTVDDEPDLNGKPVNEQVQKALAYMNNDANTATHINLAVQKKFQRYGFYTDIVSMDHYAAPSAPNVIPLTWVPVVGRQGEPKEALEYSDVLKWNTEPRRNWSWVQLAGSVWDHQPEPAAINYQFWAHVAAGAKGVEFFVAQSQTADEFPAQWNEGISLYKHWKQIRNLCLYGEPSAVVESSNPNALVRALVGPEGMVAVVLNNTMSFSGNTVTGFTTNLEELGYTIDIQVPSWIENPVAYFLTDSAKIPMYLYNYGNNLYRLTPGYSGIFLRERSHVFVIASADTIAPSAIEGLNIAQYIDSANYTFSWKESWDNVGTQGYNIYFNNVLVDQTHAPIYELKEQAMACSGYWKFEAYDNSGNKGIADSVYLVLSGGSVPVIVEQPVEEIFGQCFSDSWFFASVEATGVAGYQWQSFKYSDSQWQDLNPLIFYGAQSSELSFAIDCDNLAQLEYQGENFEQFLFGLDRFQFRCLLIDFCGEEEQFSSTTSLLIPHPEGLEELMIAQLTIYPNPASNGQFTIQIPENLKSGNLLVIDALGRTVHQQSVSNSTSRLPVQLQVSSGLYTVRIVADKVIYQCKISLVQ